MSSLLRDQINSMVKRDAKQAKQRETQQKNKRVADAVSRLQRLLQRAEENHAHRNDPLWKKCVAANYRSVPTIWDGDIVVHGVTDQRTGQRIKKPGFRVVGRVEFLPAGGFSGVIVYDSEGYVLVADGTCAPDAEWSVFTRDFHLLNLDSRGFTAEMIAEQEAAKAEKVEKPNA